MNEPTICMLWGLACGVGLMFGPIGATIVLAANVALLAHKMTRRAP